MRTKTILSMTLIAAALTLCLTNETRAGLPGLPPPPLPPLPGPPHADVQINGYLPAPPGVHVLIDSGRPYYIERDHRVYIEKERPAKHHKKHKHHENRGWKNGHYKQKGHGH